MYKLLSFLLPFSLYSMDKIDPVEKYIVSSNVSVLWFLTRSGNRDVFSLQADTKPVFPPKKINNKRKRSLEENDLDSNKK